MNNNIVIVMSLVVIGLLVGGFVGGFFYSQKEFPPEQVKAKVLTEMGCVDTTLTIEEYYFQAKLFVAMGMPEKIGRICN